MGCVGSWLRKRGALTELGPGVVLSLLSASLPFPRPARRRPPPAIPALTSLLPSLGFLAFSLSPLPPGPTPVLSVPSHRHRRSAPSRAATHHRPSPLDGTTGPFLRAHPHLPTLFSQRHRARIIIVGAKSACPLSNSRSPFSLSPYQPPALPAYLPFRLLSRR